MKIVAVSKLPPGITIENFKPDLVAAEAAQVWQLYTKGLVREINLRTDEPGAVLIMECTDVEEAKAALAPLPMVKAGVLNFDFIPLGPYLSLASLFSK